MSNLDECCRFGVLIPSGTSFGVDVKRSKEPDFCPARGGARSPGMVSAAPGGGICWVRGQLSIKPFWDLNAKSAVNDKLLRIKGGDVPVRCRLSSDLSQHQGLHCVQILWVYLAFLVHLRFPCFPCPTVKVRTVLHWVGRWAFLQAMHEQGCLEDLAKSHSPQEAMAYFLCR